MGNIYEIYMQNILESNASCYEARGWQTLNLGEKKFLGEKKLKLNVQL